MAFDPTRHEIDDKGFHVDPETGGVLGQLQKPIAKSDLDGSEYPKWVPVHSDHVTEFHGNVFTQEWPEFAIDRITKEVSVLVNNALEESLATSPAPSPDSTEN